MAKYRLNTFNDSGDIDKFFMSLGSKGFVDWFNTNMAGRQNWAGKRIEKASNWNKVWSNASILLNKTPFNLIEFLCINSIIINETGGKFMPLSEGIGSSGHPGIAYAFDKIPGVKRSYNTLTDSGNINSYKLFNDSDYIKAHGTKPMANILKNTTDTRWQGDTFPLGFSGNRNTETDKTGKSNGFIYEADFMKYRGRGYIQTTGRGAYKPIITYTLNYSGSDATINKYKSKWNSYSIDVIATTSSNDDWDDLFQNSNSIIANYAVWVHSLNAGKYSWIDPNQSDDALSKAIRKVASKIAGGGAHAYIDLFYGRVMQQLNLIEGNQAGTIKADSTPPKYIDDTPPQKATKIPDTISDTKPPPVSGSLAGITNIFPTTIKLNQITFDAPPGQANEMAESLGNFPFVYYNAYQIENRDISYLMISTNDSIPSIQITFKDTLNKMRDQGFPLDDSRIKVFINSRSDQLKSIFIEFKITKFTLKEGRYTISGLININDLYIKNYKSYPNLTSFNTLQTIAKQSGIGFSTNIDDTDDKMTWLNIGQRNIEFIDHIVETSYKSDDTFLLYYIDYYYNLTYVDLEKELNRNIKEELGVNNIGLEEIGKLKGSEKLNRLYLTNDESMASSNSYFKKYHIINNSTNISLRNGYTTKLKYYDTLNKDFLIFDIDAITNKTNDKIVLKGMPQDETFYKDNVNLQYGGKLDSSNMHKNYHYSFIQNDKNISELEKIGLDLEMASPNFNIYKFQKVYVFISNQAPTPSTDLINNRLTGEWFVADIKYKYDGLAFTQIIKLLRRDLELSNEELKSEPIQTPSPPISDNTTNPTNDTINNGITASNPISATSSIPPSPDTFILTKDIFKKIYQNRVSNKIIESHYKPMIDAMMANEINTPNRIILMFTQLNPESNYMKSIEDNGTDTYKGRGLIRISGKDEYTNFGKYFNIDITKSDIFSDNATHLKSADTQDQIKNSILCAIYKIKPFLSNADKMNYKMNIKTTMIPNSDADVMGSTDLNYQNIAIVSNKINGYKNFKDKIENWNLIRTFF